MNVEKILKGGTLTINEEMFQEVADSIEHFTKEQIMEADLPSDILFEIAEGAATDTYVRERISELLAQKYLGMSWPCYGDSAEVQNAFRIKVEQLKDNAK